MILMLYSLVACEENPRLPETYGIYLLTTSGWQRFNNEGVQSLVPATETPEILIFDQALTTQPFDFENQATWAQMTPIRSVILQVKDPEYQRKLIALVRENTNSWILNGSPQKLEGKPVKGRNDMITLLARGVPNNSKIQIKLGTKQYALTIGNSDLAVKKDRWLEVRQIWSGGGQVFNVANIENLAVSNEQILPMSELDQWPQKAEKEYNSLPEDAWEDRSLFLKIIERMDRTTYSRLLMDYGDRLRKAATSTTSEFPSVPEQLVTRAYAAAKDNALLDIVMEAKQRCKEREHQISLGLSKALENAQRTDEDANHFLSYVKDNSDALDQKLLPEKLGLGAHFLHHVTSRGERKMYWIGGFSDVEILKQETEFVGSFLGEHRKIPVYTVTLNWITEDTDGRAFQRLDFKFIAQATRTEFLKLLVLARLKLQNESKGGFVTEITAPAGYFSEGVPIGEFPWIFESLNGQVTNQTLICRECNSRVTFDPNNTKIYRDLKVTFKSLTGHSQVVRVERNPFVLSDELKAIIGPIDPIFLSKPKENPVVSKERNDPSKINSIAAHEAPSEAKISTENTNEIIRFFKEHHQRSSGSIDEFMADYADIVSVSNSKTTVNKTRTQLTEEERQDHKRFSSVSETIVSDIKVENLSSDTLSASYNLHIENILANAANSSYRANVALTAQVKKTHSGWQIIAQGTGRTPSQNIETSSPEQSANFLDVSSFIKAFLDATNQRNASVLMKFYAENVFYWNKISAQHQVMADITEYFAKYPNGAEELSGSPIISNESATQCDVKFETHWTTISRQRQERNGTSVHHWKLERRDVNFQWKIVSDYADVSLNEHSVKNAGNN